MVAFIVEQLKMPNHFSEKEQRYLAAKAEPLHERIKNDHRGIPDQSGERFQDWTETFTDSGFSLDDRLEMLDICRSRVKEHFAFSEWPPDEPLPEWISVLKELIDYVETVDSRNTDWIDPENPRPFEDFLTSIVQFTAERANVTEKFQNRRLEISVFSGFKRWFLSRLSAVASKTLDLEFRLYRRDVNSAGNEPRSGDDVYDEYISHLFNGGFRDIVGKYPVLGNYIVDQIHQWTEYVNEILDRMCSDFEEIVRWLSDSDPQTVKTIELGEGDLHDYGRSVSKITFANGTSIYYKPHCMSPEELINEVVEFVNEFEEVEYQLSSPDVLSKTSYGWVKEIPRTDITQDQVSRYYYRAGMVLAIAYIFNSNDLHYENIIASGDVPVITDAETFISRGDTGRFLREEEIEMKLLNHATSTSVLNTMLLPYTHSESQIDTPPKAAISRIDNVKGSEKITSWTNINTPQMDFEVEMATITPTDNYPSINGEPVSAKNYLDEVVDGFKQVYDEFLERDTHEIIDEFEFDGVQTRYIFRVTRMYADVVKSLLTPRSLRDAMHGTLKLDKLLLELESYTDQSRELFKPLLECERQALLELNVPSFTSSGRGIEFREETIRSEFFERTHESVVRDNIDSLSISDRSRQIGYINVLLKENSDPGV